MDLRLKNKVIIVTGSATGIGAGIVSTLSEEGAIVEYFSVEADFNEPSTCENAVQSVVDKFGRIDGLVNDAGIHHGIGLQSGSQESFRDNLHRNLVHYFLMTHLSLPHLKKSKGAIVNISSKTTETGKGNTAAYTAANGGHSALTREWAVELLKYGIRVNAVILAESSTPRTFNTAGADQMVAFLLSEKSSHTTGQLIHVNAG